MHWWGEFEVPLGVTGRWTVGPLTAWVLRESHQWQIAHRHGDEPAAGQGAVALPAGTEHARPPEDAERRRIGFDETDGRLVVSPRLADRPVVARPDVPFSLPPGERVSIYLSSPLWVRFDAAGGRVKLAEIPAWRPQDTWFGTNRSGSLCYASLTSLRLRFEDVPLRPHRVITPVLLQNEARDALDLERLSLPVTHLSVYASADGMLWTERLRLIHEESGEWARVRIDKNAPDEARDAHKVTPPREVASSDHFVSRVFTGLFG